MFLTFTDVRNYYDIFVVPVTIAYKLGVFTKYVQFVEIKGFDHVS